MLNITDSLTFDDVLLQPKYSSIRSRKEVDLSVKLSKGINIKLPILPANMKTILNIEAAYEFYKLGAMAIMHRFDTIEQQLNWIKEIKTWDNGLDYIGFSVGVKEEDYSNVAELVRNGARILCIDVAHGHSEACVRMTHYIAERYPQIFLISGNVCTSNGARDLWRAGADAVKVGVGSGSLCTTRIMTGNGIPQLSAISNVYDIRRSYEKELNRKLFIISDGGANAAGNLVKALCFSDMVMSGNLFSGALETPGEIKEIDGKRYKSYVGSSTHKTNHVEGVEALVLAKPPIEEIMNSLCEGIKSGCSYQGAPNLHELRRDPQFVRITIPGIKESSAHDVAVIIK